MDGDQIIKLISTVLNHETSNTNRRSGRRVRERRGQVGRGSNHFHRGRPRGWSSSFNAELQRDRRRTFPEQTDSGNNTPSPRQTWSWEADEAGTPTNKDSSASGDVQNGSSQHPIILAEESRAAWLQDCIQKIDMLKNIVERNVNYGNNPDNSNSNASTTKANCNKTTSKLDVNSRSEHDNREMDLSSMSCKNAHQGSNDTTHPGESCNLAEQTEIRSELDKAADDISETEPKRARIDNDDNARAAKKPRQAVRGKVINIISPLVIPTPKN